MHEASAVLEPEPLPDGRGPEDVRRFDDERITRAYPPKGPASIQTADGWKSVREPPSPGARRFGFWGETPSKAGAAALAAAEAAADPLAVPATPPPDGPPPPPSAVVDDNPSRPKLDILSIKSVFWRRAATVAVAAMAVVLLFFVAAAAICLTIRDAVGEGARTFWDGLRYEWRGFARSCRLFWESVKLGWRGK